MPILPAPSKRLGISPRLPFVLHMVAFAHRNHRTHNMLPARSNAGQPHDRDNPRSCGSDHMSCAICFGTLHRSPLWRHGSGRTVARTEEYGACGICVVEAAGVPKLLRACSTKIRLSMTVTLQAEPVLNTITTKYYLCVSNSGQHVKKSVHTDTAYGRIATRRRNQCKGNP